MTAFAELERLAREATPGPWSTCREGQCSCATVSCADYPVATVTRGKWGDLFPSLRLVGESSLALQAEPYMEMIEYGEVSPGLASANAAYIAACSPDKILRLVRIAQAAQAVVDEEPEPDILLRYERRRNRLAALREALGEKP